MVAARDLPAPSTPLIGRAAELAAVGELLTGGGGRLVTLTGPPGVGKTRLALEVAHEYAARSPGEVVWVDLAAVTSESSLAGELARALGVRDTDDLTAATLDRELLLVLDNCEQLVEAAGILAGLLAAGSRLRLLATSRRRLHLAAEQEYVVGPLPMPAADDTHDLVRLGANPSVALLLARAPRHVTLAARTARGLVDICVRLDGLPLALELAAARLRVFTPGELAFRLDRRLDLLSGGPRDAPARHRDLSAAIDWSHALLPASEQAVFRRLSVLVDHWTLEAAEAVCGGADVASVTDAVSSLLDQSLVRRVPGEAREARFAMLASVREFARDRLSAAGESEAVETAHARWFARVSRRWEESIGTDAEEDTWPDLGDVHDDLSTALATARRGDDVDAVLWLTSGLAWFAYTRGTLAEARALLDQRGSGTDIGGDPDARIAALVAVGAVALSLGEPELAERTLLGVVSALDRRDDSDSVRRTAIALAFLGHVARATGRLDLAAERYAGARTAYERLGSSAGTAWALWDLGVLLAETGDRDGAERWLRASLDIFSGRDYPWATAHATWALATVLLDRGGAADVDEAARLLVRALALHESVADRRGVVQSLEALADVALARDRPSDAARLLGAASARRAATGARITAAEADLLAARSDRVTRRMGRDRADREQRIGRDLPAPAVSSLATQVAADPLAADQAPDGVPLTLTDRQREVATLVAAGGTNRQIGRALGISDRTVEIHVRHLMDRLDVPSRAGVAAWAATHADPSTPSGPSRGPV